MKLLLDKDGKVVVRNGFPVYVDDNGTEIEFDAPGSIASVARLRQEAKGHRERAEALATQVEAFKDINPEDARKALTLARNLDEKKLIDAGKVEEVKAAIVKEYEAKVQTEKARADGLENNLIQEKIGGAFARSGYIKEKLLVPADIAQSFFGANFKLEDGKIVAYDANKQKIYSKSNPGNDPDFDEALSIVVGQYAGRDSILKGPVGSGGGSGKGGGSGGGGAKQMTRAEFDAKAPTEKAQLMRDGMKVVDA